MRRISIYDKYEFELCPKTRQPLIYSTHPRYCRKPLTKHLCGTGAKYQAVSMFNKLKYVHHIVAEIFLGQRPLGFQINHINGNRHDNRPENLEYCTVQQNIQHAYDLGLNRSGKDHEWYKGGLSKNKKQYCHDYHIKHRDNILARKRRLYKIKKEANK
jgi:hypothetical protein